MVCQLRLNICAKFSICCVLKENEWRINEYADFFRQSIIKFPLSQTCTIRTLVMAVLRFSQRCPVIVRLHLVLINRPIINFSEDNLVTHQAITNKSVISEN